MRRVTLITGCIVSSGGSVRRTVFFDNTASTANGPILLSDSFLAWSPHRFVVSNRTWSPILYSGGGWRF